MNQLQLLAALAVEDCCSDSSKMLTGVCRILQKITHFLLKLVFCTIIPYKTQRLYFKGKKV